MRQMFITGATEWTRVAGGAPKDIQMVSGWEVTAVTLGPLSLPRVSPLGISLLKNLP